MDAIFGRRNFRNEIVWWYEKWTNAARYFQRNHDTIFFYVKGDGYTFNKPYEPHTEMQKTLMRRGYNLGSSGGKKIARIYDRSKISESRIAEWEHEGRAIYYVATPKGKAMPNVWQMPILGGGAKERTGYRTQKPLALLDRIIEASSNKHDIVFDPFCGCATTCVAADALNRQWVGIDISEMAAELVKHRINDMTRTIINRTDIPQRTDLGKLTPYNSPANKTKLYGEQQGYCNGCSTHFEMRNLEVDHIIGRKVGGTDHLDNLQLLCGSCNRVKGNRGMEYLIARLKSDNTRRGY